MRVWDGNEDFNIINNEAFCKSIEGIAIIVIPAKLVSANNKQGAGIRIFLKG